MTEHKNMPDSPETGNSTEHRHEWRVCEKPIGGMMAYCADFTCKIRLTLDEVERILNDYERLKRALSAEDAKEIAVNAGLCLSYEGRKMLRDYAAILEGDDE